MKKLNLEAIRKWAQNSPLIFGFTLCVVIVSSLITLLEGGPKLITNIVDILYPQGKYYRMADSISTDVRIEYLESILGPAQIKNSSGSIAKYIFINDYFYTQADTLNGQVMMYAITSRRGDFHPEYNGAYLGKTTFAELDKIFQGECRIAGGGLGARRFDYWEVCWGGNPSNYQEYGFGLNDAGDLGDVEVYILDQFNYVDNWNSLRESKEMIAFRSKSLINTYAVASPSYTLDNEIGLGVDKDQVRLLEKKYRNW